MGNTWTDQQKMAIQAKDSDILVSAAAGSGKTAVLVERIISAVTAEQNPRDIDRMLVVTFTKAAASEMSQRIGAAISAKLEEQPDNAHLQNQLTLLNRADIKTIHAFCLQVIREYYSRLDLDPAVKTADPSEISLLQKEVLADLFEELYGEEREDFLLLLETYGEATGDRKLQELILQVYEFAQGYPQPKVLLERMAEMFFLRPEDTVDTCVWMELVQEGIRNGVDFVRYLLKKAEERVAGDSGFTAYAQRLGAECAAAEELALVLEERNYRRWHMAYVAMEFARLPAYRGEDKESAEYVKGLRNEAKAAWGKLGEKYFRYGEETQSSLIRQLYPVAKALSEITILFMDRFAEAKKEKLWIDFHDYEHFALEILTEKGSEPGHVIPSDAAREIAGKYDEIMIDEYQDSNLVQEMALSAVSGEWEGKNNRFMVGDVKQSIYRFRLAMPQLFNEKYRVYPIQAGGKTRKIILSKNFRSRKNVLDGINFLFRQIMSLEFGDVDYNEEAALYAGARFPACQGLCGGDNEILLVETALPEESELPEEIEEMGRRELEATAIAAKIKEMMAAGYQVLDHGEYRPMSFGDVAVLLRSVKNWGSVLDDCFARAGIPYFAETASGYYDVPEVDTVLNLLRLIDNPLQDIPLLSLLHSPIYGINADGLAQIRLFGGEGRFYDCVLAYAADGEETDIRNKLEKFLTDLSRWRQEERQLSLTELLRMLYRETGYYDYVGLTAGGRLRQANLRLLLEKAEQFEKNSRRGLFFFVRFVESMKTAEAESSSAKLQNAGEDLVRVMTIHKSKGLEFPVVFLADTVKKFNEADGRAPVITHQQWGYGMDYTDLEQRAVYSTLAKTALAEEVRLENLSEEVRVLYVALTRAKEKLILTGAVKDIRKSLTKWMETADSQEERLPLFRLRRGANYLDWIMPAFLRHPTGRAMAQEWGIEPAGRTLPDESCWSWQVRSRMDLYLEEKEETEVARDLKEYYRNWESVGDYSGSRQEIFRVLSWQYPYGEETALPAKVSISEIKRRNAAEITGEEPTPAEMPWFSEKVRTERLTAAQIGTAMHVFMEAADFRREYDAGEIQELLAELVAEDRLSAREAAAVRRKELLAFFRSDLSKRMRVAERIEKERPFSMLVEPKDIFREEKYCNMEEYIQINGIMDCFFYEEDGVVLVDYKSDRVYDEEILKERYQIQMALYREALERVTDRPVKEVYLYSFAMGKAVSMGM
ncbi:helicase-exonuclease AddAB subunit AddA [Anaerotignum lactatifermentans]|uniref:ATP-dependent helicase/nuclease subunit A n=1 Tax=Anaerotignum lactatifermentans TaxID=160404 RepID=A0ABS2GAE1_9FIRM|nr:helicase-exonuclease AddAB subunit AddA [Anaerotignum lactatifermentans]MBM6828307.1 helicase-exonuclease AddAB subunit AddA [Anaerotignum lactatifermentans]MBM6877587.1 helicase-exonuclease AddAB subunit AddA [Anaerotignum lactatifermentans]MBM6949890.1 helicase-exonuclease AddAB subunit AddA [Anaerotignum lactatifermentans]